MYLAISAPSVKKAFISKCPSISVLSAPLPAEYSHHICVGGIIAWIALVTESIFLCYTANPHLDEIDKTAIFKLEVYEMHLAGTGLGEMLFRKFWICT